MQISGSTLTLNTDEIPENIDPPSAVFPPTPSFLNAFLASNPAFEGFREKLAFFDSPQLPNSVEELQELIISSLPELPSSMAIFLSQLVIKFKN
jgi:hypothetical protein